MSFVPSPKILNNYARVLINFALNSGLGVKKNEVVFLQVPESAKPLLIELNRVVLDSGAHPIIQYLPDEMIKDFFSHASEDQINFFPAAFFKGKVNQADHMVTIIAETDKHELEGVDPKKIMNYQKAYQPYKDWRERKENQKKFTWTLGLYGTPAMASEANLTLEECWRQIIKACYLDQPDPIGQWRQAIKTINQVKTNLNKLNIRRLHVKSKNTDLTIGIDENRQWLGGDGRNIPSFEIFISPDWRLTQGYVFFDLPLYRYGNLITDIRLEFNQGRVVFCQASQGQKVLEEMINTKNADKIGEFSLTDKRLSRIDKFMAETLFDENYGGKYGNFHLALGSAYRESYPGKLAHISKKQWSKIGFNQSVVHTDIISTENRTVIAQLSDGSSLPIYRDGCFLL